MDRYYKYDSDLKILLESDVPFERPTIREVADQGIIDWVNQPHEGRVTHSPEHPVTAAIAGGKSGFNYTTVTAPFGCWAENILFTHDERPSKDGLALLGGVIRNGRQDKDVVAISMLTYEVDGRLPLDAAVTALEEAKKQSVLWTTANHARTSQSVPYGTFSKWHIETLGSPCTKIKAEVVADFCAQSTRFRHLRNVTLANDGQLNRVGEVLNFDIAHDPEDKYRVTFPLVAPIPLQGGSALPISQFTRLYHAFGDGIFGADVHSRESSNPARLHYLGSHQPGMPFTVLHFDHEWVDSRDINLPPEPISRARSLVTTLVGHGELRHVLRSIPPDLPYPEWYRCLCALHHASGGEAHDLAHAWSAGDPRYRPHQVDAIWDSVDESHPRPAGMGTLVALAQEHDKRFQHYERSLAASTGSIRKGAFDD